MTVRRNDMVQAFHINVWTDQDEKRSYAAMAETREEALALAREKLPSTWRIEAPENWPPYALGVVLDHELEPGDVRWITSGEG
jgi:hypothetical protein